MAYGDNSKLEELMKINPNIMTEENMGELFDELKNTEVLVPGTFSSQLTDGDNLKEGETVILDKPTKFKFITLKTNDLTQLPLFTDVDTLPDSLGSDMLSLPVVEIAKLLVEADDVDEVVINPNTDYSIGINKDIFVFKCLYEDIKKLVDVQKDIKDHSLPLDENMVLSLRSQTPFMLEEAEDGIFSTYEVFAANIADVCNTDFKYLNKLYVPKGTIALYLGNVIEDVETEHDIFLSPKLKFKLISQDGNTFEWMCIEQDVE